MSLYHIVTLTIGHVTPRLDNLCCLIISIWVLGIVSTLFWNYMNINRIKKKHLGLSGCLEEQVFKIQRSQAFRTNQLDKYDFFKYNLNEALSEE